MAAQRVSGNNNRTVTVQVLASNTPSAYSTTTVIVATPCTSTRGKSNSPRTILRLRKLSIYCLSQ